MKDQGTTEGVRVFLLLFLFSLLLRSWTGLILMVRLVEGTGGLLTDGWTGKRELSVTA